ncbi:Pyruvate:ferredoxin oxidoreductase, alpha subunit [Pyrodictium delaneyi]|uniref:2-oxoacid oxidoreductase (ferredoxin) n=2 Tax=Pyrodictium delaneyi TaxID=1273541 RepID=A0A0P0N429_9CREN|nr:transketolase C-terminal domain-containing protein [Pyrodictium delaneyi]ALL01491.1 Pyruvate:ferredoxin oxidoreductase, alpha subunit [Pyrodictium delaneyi]
MPVLTSMRGNEAVAYAAKLARVEVVAAYPITPQTIVVEKIDELIASGEMNAEMIHVESEHSALAAAYGAAAGGVRAFTATSSHGLAYMYEMLWWTAASRIPLVMAIITRALGPPWNIHVEHADLMSTRDTGWLIAMAENNQEALDLTLMMFRVTEDPRVYLPGIIGLDGFILSHTVEPLELPDQETVDEFLPPRRQPYVMEPGEPKAMGNLVPDEYFEELRMDMHQSLARARQVIMEAGREYGRLTGRSYESLVECYRCNDADIVIAGMGSWMGDAKITADVLREKGLRTGVLRLRWVRPFPWEEIREAAMGKKLLVVLDRSVSFGHAGPLFLEISSAVEAKPSMVGILAGVGGVDISYEDIARMVEHIYEMVEERGRVYIPAYWYHLGKFHPMPPYESVFLAPEQAPKGE